MQNKIWKLKTEHLNLGNYSFEVIKKKINNIYFRIYPSKGKIIISAPVSIDLETLNKAILSKSDWLNGQVKKSSIAEPVSIKTYTTGEALLFKGKIYSLNVSYQNSRSKAFITFDNRIQLVVKPGTTVFQREKILIAFYRKELKRSIGIYVAKWQPLMGVIVNEFNVRIMKTRWGSCNINAKRIWLNLALVKCVDSFIEYVVVHEMVHLLERNHNARFKGFMDKFIPDWKRLKKELNQLGL